MAGLTKPTSEVHLPRQMPGVSITTSQVSSMMKSQYILLVFILSISEYLVTGAPTTYISSPAEDALSTYLCTDLQTWSTTHFYPKHCATAVSQFFVQELLVHGDAILEFHGVGAHAQSRYPSEMLPQKFTYGEFHI